MAPPTKKPARAPKEYVANLPVGEGAIHLNSYWGVDFGDQSLWATSLVSAKRRKGKSAPGAVDLENAITGIQITDTIAGFSTIVVKFEDPEWKLIRSGFFDANEDGRLDALDVNYPIGSDLWWRASQVSVDANRASASISLTFIERAAAWLLNKKGPLKAGRTAKRTRAQFLKGLVNQVKAGDLVFHCQQLSEAQVVEKDTHDYSPSPGTLAPLTDSGKPITVVTDHPKAKTKGIHSKANITIKGVKAVPEQIKQIEICMKVADRLSAPPKAVKSMLVAGIGESRFLTGAAEQVYGTHKGVFQSYLIPPSDTEQQCTYFFKGDRSFLTGGAIGLVKSHPEYSVGTVAAKVEKSDGSAGYYDGFAGEADKIMVAYGHGGLGSTASDTGSDYRKQYNFEVGGPDHPGESFWEAMVRIAGEVKWALFLDGNHVYYDAETTLIRAKPATYIDRLDESVVSFSSTWDSRNIASEATLELICDPFEFRAGDVLVLRGFGPSSTGSTVNPPLPGRWLIDEIDRDRFDFTSTFRLKQPVHPGREPLGDLGHHKGRDSESTGGSGATSGVWPGQFPVTGAYGTQRPGHIHAGLDVGVPHGTDCTAPIDGTITYVSNTGFGVAGGMVHLRADSTIAGLRRGDKIGWGHCTNAKVKVGDKVKAGTVVAKSNGSPAHVHFVLINKDGGGNGIDGNADPSAFLKGIGSIPGGGTPSHTPGAPGNINTDQYYAMANGKVIRK
jgi:hypothetical protein